MIYTDYSIVCGLSTDGEPDDWLHLGIPVHPTEIWELQFQCCHKSGAPDATVIGSFVMFDNQGAYIGTTPGSVDVLTDSTSWQTHKFLYQFTQLAYVFPAIWWHSATVLVARYLSAVQMSRIVSSGGAAVVLTPDIFLTLGVDAKKLAGPQSHMGPT